MKVKKLTKEVRKAVCALLTAAMVLTNTGMTVFAEESAQTEDALTEQTLTEADLQEETEVIFTGEEETVETENDSAEDSSLTGEDASAEAQTDAETENQTQKETVSESAEAVETETIESETADISESEIQETQAVLEADENSGVKWSGTYESITWAIGEDGKLTVTGTGEFAPVYSNSTERAPWFEGKADIITAEINVQGLTNASYMFYNCQNLTSVDVSNFDTSSVRDMSSMFEDCRNLTALDVSRFNTSSVRDMSDMFSGCSSLTALDVSKFDTSSVRDMSDMFSGCSSLTALDVSKFDTSSVTNMTTMFYGCSSLAVLDVSSFDTSSVTGIASMFASCSSLTALDVSKFDTGGVTDMTSMFSGCSSLTALDVSKFDTGKVDSMTGMFDSCSKLTALDLSGFDTGKVSYMTSMFHDCSSLTALDLSSFDMSSAEDNTYAVGDMLSGCTSLSLLYTPRNLRLSVPLPTSAWHTLDNIEKTGLPTNSSDSVLLIQGSTTPNITPGVKNKAGFQFSSGSAMPFITPGIKAKKIKTSFTAGSEINEDDITVRYYSSDGTVKILDEYACQVHTREIDELEVGTHPLRITYEYEDQEEYETEIPITILPDDGGENEGNMSGTYENITWAIDANGKLTVKGTGEFAPLTDINNGDKRAPWYKYIEYIKTAEIDVQGMTNAMGMLSGCCYLTEVDLSKFDTSSVTDMSYMFNYCSELTNVDLSRFDTSHVTSMRSMFEDCNVLENLDISGFDTKNVTDMSSMFFRCWCLRSLDFSSFDTKNVTDMHAMFYGCQHLPSLDLRSFDTGNVTDMSTMFLGCEDVTSLDVSSFNTEKVTNMMSMFYSCYKLTSLDLSNFDAKNVTDISTLFGMYSKYNDSYECYSDALTDLYTPRNVSVLTDAVKLPRGTWYDEDGNTYTELPKELSYSIHLAKGKKPVGFYTVTFDLSGKGDKIIKTGVAGGSTLEKPQPQEVKGYIFTGWYKDKECTVVWDFASDTVQADTTLYAGWAEDKDDSHYTDAERADYDLGKISTIAAIKSKVYDGNAYEPVVKVTARVDGKNTTLTEGADYRVFYADNVSAGENTGTVIIKGNGIYSGEQTATFTITPKPVKKLKVITGSIVGNVSGMEASALPVHTVCVYDGTKLLKEGADYTLSGLKPTKSGAEVKVTGTGNYNGEVIAKLTVYGAGEKLIIKAGDVKLDKESVPYTGKAVKDVKPTVKVNGATLEKDKDYKVQYQNNKDAGTAYVIVTGKGAYKGKAVVPFTIKAETTALTVSVKPAKAYTGKLQKPAVTVSIQKDGKPKKLAKKDYTVVYKNNLHAGTATVTVIGKGNYAGLKGEGTFTIEKQDIKKASIKGTKANLELFYNKNKLIKGKDYQEPAYGTEDKGKVTVTIKAIGGDCDFTGELIKKIKVN